MGIDPLASYVSRRAVFLDRDGVLNEARIKDGKPFPPIGLADLRITSDGAESLTELSRAGFLLICVTNQPDVARGTQTREVVEAINETVRSRLPLADVLTCYHDERDGCACRKPRPGLLVAAAARYSIDLSASFMVGDRWTDIEAGLAAGCTTILLGNGYGENAPSIAPDKECVSLRAATDWILGHR